MGTTELRIDMIEYFTRENRPFNNTNVIDGLAGKYKKTEVQRMMDKLADEGVLVMKQYKKQKIYVVNQETLPKFDEEEMAAIDGRIAVLAEEASALDAELAELSGRNRELESAMSNEALAAALDGLRTEAETKRAKLAGLEAGSVEVLSVEDIDKLNAKYALCYKAWKKRKRMVKDCVDLLADNSGKKSSVLYEEMGIETDEEVGVKIEDLPAPEPPRKRQKRR